MAQPSPLPRPRDSTGAAACGDAALERDLQTIGRRIRERRRSLGMTLVQLAEAAGLSHPFLSQLERAKARPSLASLQRVAQALGTSQLELMVGPSAGSGPVEVVDRAGGAQGPFGGGQARLLAHGDDRLLPMEFTGSGTRPGDFYLHAAAELLYVLEGVVVVDLGEHGTYRLRTGDSVHYSGGVPHRWYSGGPDRFRLVVVKHALDAAAPSVFTAIS